MSFSPFRLIWPLEKLVLLQQFLLRPLSSLMLSYCPGLVSKTFARMVFHVFDVDTKYHNLLVKSLKMNKQDFLGETSCVLSEIVTKQTKTLTLQLQDKNGFGGTINHGTLTAHAEEAVTSRQAVDITFRCSHLDNKDLFSKSDPFLRISRIIEGGKPIPICKTEVAKDNLNPTWKPLCLTLKHCGSKDTPLVIECLEFNNSSNHELIGELQKLVANLETLHQENAGVNFHLPSSIRKEHVKVDVELSFFSTGSLETLKGQLFVDGFCEKIQYTFLDYISSGFELNFMVVVDFTASNGNPQTPDSPPPPLLRCSHRSSN